VDKIYSPLFSRDNSFGRFLGQLHLLNLSILVHSGFTYFGKQKIEILFLLVNPQSTQRVEISIHFLAYISIMMEKLAQAGEGEGVHAHPFSLFLPSRKKL
jgi:hypothetical protein